MNELNKWSVGKKVGTILLAREMAASTEETFGYLDMLHKGESLRGCRRASASGTRREGLKSV